MRSWKPEDIFELDCPWCDTEIEFWKDEPLRICRGCGREIRNPRLDPGCAKWCAFAPECIGHAAPDEAPDVALHHRLIAEMRSVCSQELSRIEHAAEVLEYAERILEAEGGDALIVRAAALLLELGVPESERQAPPSTMVDEQSEGARLARAILERLEVAAPAIEHICRIVGSRRSASEADTHAFRIVRDAEWLADIPRQHAGLEREELATLIGDVFRTRTGRELAEKKFLDR
jgi:hypothetical protein